MRDTGPTLAKPAEQRRRPRQRLASVLAGRPGYPSHRPHSRTHQRPSYVLRPWWRQIAPSRIQFGDASWPSGTSLSPIEKLRYLPRVRARRKILVSSPKNRGQNLGGPISACRHARRMAAGSVQALPAGQGPPCLGARGGVNFYAFIKTRSQFLRVPKISPKENGIGRAAGEHPSAMPIVRYRSGFGLHSFASRCASAICPRVILVANVSRRSANCAGCARPAGSAKRLLPTSAGSTGPTSVPLSDRNRTCRSTTSPELPRASNRAVAAVEG